MTLTSKDTEFRKRGVKIVNIARDIPKKLQEFRDKNHISLPIIADRSGSIVKSYNVYQTAKLSDSLYLKFRLAIPSTFFINQKGRIIWAYVGTREDRPSVELLLQVIDSFLLLK